MKAGRRAPWTAPGAVVHPQCGTLPTHSWQMEPCARHPGDLLNMGWIAENSADCVAPPNLRADMTHREFTRLCPQVVLIVIERLSGTALPNQVGPRVSGAESDPAAFCQNQRVNAQHERSPELATRQPGVARLEGERDAGVRGTRHLLAALDRRRGRAKTQLPHAEVRAEDDSGRTAGIAFLAAQSTRACGGAQYSGRKKAVRQSHLAQTRNRISTAPGKYRLLRRAGCLKGFPNDCGLDLMIRSSKLAGTGEIRVYLPRSSHRSGAALEQWVRSEKIHA